MHLPLSPASGARRIPFEFHTKQAAVLASGRIHARLLERLGALWQGLSLQTATFTLGTLSYVDSAQPVDALRQQGLRVELGFAGCCFLVLVVPCILDLARL